MVRDWSGPEFAKLMELLPEAVHIADWQGGEGVWWRSEKEHLIGFFSEMDGVGAYGRAKAQTAKGGYNQFKDWHGLVWLITALGIDPRRVSNAVYNALDAEEAGKSLQTCAAAIRKEVPWDEVANLMAQLESASKGKTKAPGKTSGLHATSIDTFFNFGSDTPVGKDCDSHSSTLRRYHQLLWSKPLPNGEVFNLTMPTKGYLQYSGPAGRFDLASDWMATDMNAKVSKWLTEELIIEFMESQGVEAISAEPEDEAESEDELQDGEFFYTIGQSIIFPGNRIGGQPTINGNRGLHPKIGDRFDLTLECIRRYYAGIPSPLTDTLIRYDDFFQLFVDFEGYVDFFLLQDLVENDEVLFFHHFDDFKTPPDPKNVEDYYAFLGATNGFFAMRSQRIQNYVLQHGLALPEDYSDGA